MSERWRDTYDAWKPATPPEYEITAAEEQALIEAEETQIDRLRDAIACALDDERGDLTFEQVLSVLIAVTQDLKRW